ncbi:MULTISPECIES: carboxypeptidase-like regulatory domain-containing protein [unclassified Calothrix]|uniref:carboxypeptidase-like regulatory domain-containing protein n=1 Tax=unclassified Calothrix TaxID=2619626 RepID=UPI0028C3CD1B|nr:carboxypeptidase-like regulatory domain-containing protein [Calothrix sp. FACHB-168]
MSYLLSHSELLTNTDYLPHGNAIAQNQQPLSIANTRSPEVTIKPTSPESLPPLPLYSPAKENLDRNPTLPSLDLQTSEFQREQFAPMVAPESFFTEASLSDSPADRNLNQQRSPLPQTSGSQTDASVIAGETISSSQSSQEQNTKTTGRTPSIKLPLSEDFSVFPVGLDVDQRQIIKSLLIRGQEDGTQAVDFERWLIPYEAVVKALQLNVNLSNGQLEIRAPGLVTRIDPRELNNDRKLGLVFSVAQLQTLLGIKVTFDINDYALRLERPWLLHPSQLIAAPEPIVELTGLPEVPAPDLTLTAVEQRLNVTGSSSRAANYQGDLAAVGTALGGSWFVRINQPNVQNSISWKLAETQFLRQTDSADYIIGSQAPFWLSQGTGDYWGLTTIQRWGFTPPETVGGSSPNQRMQSAQIGRVITGTAEPGTLVRLTQGLSERVIAEVLVDSSGIYRFNDVPVDSRFLGANYQLLLYPQGQLTQTPEIRSVTFSILPGQLPAGGSALVVSGGLRRQLSNNNSFIGDFTDFRGGVAQRWGIASDLTVGIGGVYDGSLRGLAEIFYQPENLPLKVALSALSGEQWDINANVTFQISPSINTRFISDRFKTRFDFDWRMSSWLSLFGGVDSRDGEFVGLQITQHNQNSYTFARLTYNSDNYLRWNLMQRLGQLELKSNGNEVSSFSELAYYFSPEKFTRQGNSLYVSYETNDIFANSDRLASFGWRYRSPQVTLNGDSLWELQLGYGLGSQGSGIVAAIGTNIIPGLSLRGRYQGISATSDEPSFALELVSSLNLQRGIKPNAARQFNNLRTQGGILLQPFFDRNGNGKRDANEPVYLENSPLLFSINNQNLQSLTSEMQDDGALVHLSPGKYRLDLDPAGFPTNWQTSVDSLAVDVVAGSYTPVMLPMVRSFTRSGILTDSQGKPIPGARVEAIDVNSGQKRFSVTNAAGVYYLQGLQQGNYKIEVNGESINTQNLLIEESSAAFQQLNLN